MEAKIEKISKLSKLLSVKTRMSDDLFHLFDKFGIGHLLSHLSLKKRLGRRPNTLWIQSAVITKRCTKSL